MGSSSVDGFSFDLVPFCRTASTYSITPGPCRLGMRSFVCSAGANTSTRIRATVAYLTLLSIITLDISDKI